MVLQGCLRDWPDHKTRFNKSSFCAVCQKNCGIDANRPPQCSGVLVEVELESCHRAASARCRLIHIARDTILATSFIGRPYARPFYEIAASGSAPIAAEVLARIAEFHAIEVEIWSAALSDRRRPGRSSTA